MTTVKRLATVLPALGLLAGTPCLVLAQPPDDLQAKIDGLIEKMGRSHMEGKQAHEQLIAIGRPAVPALIKAGDDRKALRRWWAVAALCAIGDERAVDVVLRRMKDRNGTVRHVAIYHSRKFVRRAPRVKEALLTVLESPASGDVEWALRGLGLARYRPALPNIKKTAEHADPKVRWRSLEAIHKMDAVGSIPFFAERLRKDTEPALRRVAAAFLVKTRIPDQRTVGALVGALRDRSPEVRVTAFRGLRQLVDPPFALPEPIEDIPTEVAREAVKWWLANRDRYPAVGKPGQRPTSRPAASNGEKRATP